MRFIHLVRDPRAVVWSVLRGRISSGDDRNRFSQLMLAMKVTLSWAVANLAADTFRVIYPSTSNQLRYDALLWHGAPRALSDIMPVGSLESIVLGQNANCHCIAGNSMRYQHKTMIALDEAWRDEMPSSLALLVNALAWPLMFKYGFFQDGRKKT